MVAQALIPKTLPPARHWNGGEVRVRARRGGAALGAHFDNNQVEHFASGVRASWLCPQWPRGHYQSTQRHASCRSVGIA